MPIHKLTASKIASLIRTKHTGRVNDGGNLYLDLQDGTGYWLFRYKRFGKQHYMGIGPARSVTLDDARNAALTARKDLHAERDPIATRKATQIAAQLEAAKAI